MIFVGACTPNGSWDLGIKLLFVPFTLPPVIKNLQFDTAEFIPLWELFALLTEAKILFLAVN